MNRTLLAVCIVLLIAATAFYWIAIRPWLLLPTEPVSISLSEDRIEEYLGIHIPASAKFVEGYSCPGRDLTEIYIFEFDLPEECDADSADLYLREELKLDQTRYSETWLTVNSSLTWDPTLDDMGYSFTHYIVYNEWDWSEIHYCIDGDVLLVAMVCGDS